MRASLTAPAFFHSGLKYGAPSLSDDLLHFPSDPKNYVPAGNGPKLELRVVDANNNVQRSVWIVPVLFATTKLPEGFVMPAPTQRPVRQRTS
jgi:hypothetical protein